MHNPHYEQNRDEIQKQIIALKESGFTYAQIKAHVNLSVQTIHVVLKAHGFAKSKVTEHDKYLIKELRFTEKLPYRVIAEKFERSITTIKDVCMSDKRYFLMKNKRMKWNYD